MARELLGLPSGKRLLLFGALNVTDKRKGIDYLIEALRRMEKQDVELVVFGQVKDDIRGLFPVPIHSMGYLSDESKIVALYSCRYVYHFFLGGKPPQHNHGVDGVWNSLCRV